MRVALLGTRAHTPEEFRDALAASQYEMTSVCVSSARRAEAIIVFHCCVEDGDEVLRARSLGVPVYVYYTRC